jgi:tripartite-type tricarboxylate transporter receptor subunit TctC
MRPGYSIAVGIALVAASMPASAQSDPTAGFPRKPVRMIVPFPPGGGTDILARPIAQKLTERWGQQVIVDNRAGAGGIIGTDLTAKTPPDGYSFMLATNGTHGINQSLYRKLPYDTLRDFTPITLVAIAPNILVVHPSVPVSTVKELIALAKAKPGALNYATPGNGTPPHLAAEIFKSMAGVNITHVPYKGAGPAVIDVLGGQMQVMFANAPVVLPHIRAGKLRSLATTSAKRLSILADFPTIAESGLPGYEADTWYGMFGPAGMPAPLLNKINQDLVRVLALPEIKELFAGQGAEVSTNTPAQFAPMVKHEVERWAKVIKQTGIHVD